jgi:hypothetical protein
MAIRLGDKDIENLIELYREERCLWDVTTDEYSNIAVPERHHCTAIHIQQSQQFKLNRRAGIP